MSKKNKIVIYTAISNDYDVLNDPLELTPDADYVCFTDTFNQESNVWEFREFPNNKLDFVRKCRYVKILSHKLFSDYDYSLWIDGNIIIKKDLTPLIKKHIKNKNEKFITFKHPYRNCIYKEAKACVSQDKDDKLVISKQIDLYKSKGYPSDNSLVESRVILRKHNNEFVKKTMNDWWSEINTKSRRDQLSFNYVAWKNDFSYSYFKNYIKENKYFDLLGHNEKGLKKIKQIIRKYIFLNRNKSTFHNYVYKIFRLIWRNLKKVINNV